MTFLSLMPGHLPWESYARTAQKVLIDKVVAVVGDNIILQSDIEAQYQQLANPKPGHNRCQPMNGASFLITVAG